MSDVEQTVTPERTGPGPERIDTSYHVQAAVALDTIEALSQRVLNLLATGRRITLARRWVDRDSPMQVVAGLIVQGEPQLHRRDDGAWFGVNLEPGIHGFGISAYGSDGNAVEAEVWRRYHAASDGDFWTRRRNITTVEIQGGLANSGPGRNDSLLIRHWNEHAVCEEIVVAFDPSTNRIDDAVVELAAEVAWRKEAMNPDKAEIGRVVGLEDALTIAHRLAKR